MMRALSTAATGMQAQQLNVDTIANNLANVNTASFKKANVRFQAPARLGDVCQVITRPREGSTYRLIMDQEIMCEGRRLVRAEIHIVCLDSEFKLQEMPPPYRMIGGSSGSSGSGSGLGSISGGGQSSSGSTGAA